uniref:Uncharacterized protein n=1 Tax=Acrobeloides nanus TaxID=290746 RepID=A0A914BYA6_9BILA
MYANTIEQLSLQTNIVEDKTNLVFKELHNYYITNFGLEHGVLKYSKLLQLTNDLNDIHNRLQEAYTIGKLFDPTLLCVWNDAI